MEIKKIEHGIVIDHIEAGLGLKVLDYLKIKSDDQIALIMNVESKKLGKKDLLKIENINEVNLDAIGLLDHNATVSYIENYKTVKKITLSLPEKIINIIKCKNPRCITMVEKDIDQKLTLFDAQRKIYRCEYCDSLIQC